MPIPKLHNSELPRRRSSHTTNLQVAGEATAPLSKPGETMKASAAIRAYHKRRGLAYSWRGDASKKRPPTFLPNVDYSEPAEQ